MFYFFLVYNISGTFRGLTLNIFTFYLSSLSVFNCAIVIVSAFYRIVEKKILHETINLYAYAWFFALPKPKTSFIISFNFFFFTGATQNPERNGNQCARCRNCCGEGTILFSQFKC